MFLRVVHKEKSAEMTVFQRISYNRVIVWWCHQESNRGHKDFQSFALPTELWHLMLVRSGNISFAVAKVVKLLDSASLMEIKNTDKKLVG